MTVRLSRSFCSKDNPVRYILPILILLALTTVADARTQLRNICRIKGQEENVLRGWGLVVGLNGTGEANDGPTMRAISQAMQVMGSPLALDAQSGDPALDELKKIKNATMVMVETVVPATGARRGDRLDCTVSALGGKSLVGGRLAFAALQGPNTKDTRVFALCQGQIMVEDDEQPMVGVIHNGCQMEADIFTKFYREDGTITLVLDDNHANFLTAADIVDKITERFAAREMRSQSSDRNASTVYAQDAANIVVAIPAQYRGHEVEFAAVILGIEIYDYEPEARVTINSRAGSIVISGDVEIGDVAITHRNSVTVNADASPSFSGLSTEDPEMPKLKDLLNQLDALKVSTDDMIDIIKGIDKAGKLHGHLIVQ
jgi:flagellar P-ring protein precursor FlgI